MPTNEEDDGNRMNKQVSLESAHKSSIRIEDNENKMDDEKIDLIMDKLTLKKSPVTVIALVSFGKQDPP